MSSFRPMLLLALIASAPAVAGEVTVQDLARRLQALEQRLGESPPPAAAGSFDPAALDQRLRILERKLELQAEADEARRLEDDEIERRDAADEDREFRAEEERGL